MRVVVAMSGGVDSSLAAALLAEQGHEVVGVSMQLHDQTEGAGPSFGRCCALDDLHDARPPWRAAWASPTTWCASSGPSTTGWWRPSCADYLAGRTPLPCARCNTEVKFQALVEKTLGLGASQVATGHYARRERSDAEAGRWRLLRGLDAGKDQSYFLFGLTQAQLELALFPVGDLTKAEVRAEAAQRGLPTADKPESQEICFVPDGDVAGFVERQAGRASRAAGPIVDEAGRPLGRHAGLHGFTVGQRRGLGL